MLQTFGNTSSPSSISGSELDDYLLKGWFRMGQSIFTCNFLNFKRVFYNSIWLRICLNGYEEDNTFKKLKKINSGFKTVIGPASISQEKEELYTKYKTGITFDASSSIASLLLENKSTSIYATQEVCVYDHDKLIAVGYFDLGEKSAAGIVSFYDPEYKKHSLGKYLIYNKVNFCHEHGLTYFYPGYFAPNYPLFDYKLTIGKNNLEFLNFKTDQWQSINTFSAKNNLIDYMSYRLLIMEYLLLENNVKFVKMNYEFYNGNCISDLQGLNLFDYPIFIFIFSPNHIGFNPVIVYDIITQEYKLVKCISTHYNPDYVSKDQYFGTHIMKISEVIFNNPQAELFPELFLLNDLQSNLN